MTNILKLLSVVCLFVGLSLTSCGNGKKNLADRSSGDMEEYENSDVNAITQALPVIMILPGDKTLQEFNAISRKNYDGKDILERDYVKYLSSDDRFRRIASSIQESFNQDNYPLQDFEQTLKQLQTRGATDMADDLYQDAKTLLLQTASPDIILDLNYFELGNGNVYTRKTQKNKVVSYTLNALDAYTNKVVSTINENNLTGGKSVTEIIDASLQEHLPKLKKDIVKYFSDLQTRGREVTLRVTVAKGSNQDLSDENIEGDTYADYIIDYVKTHTVKGAYKLQNNTKDELYLVNVRIPMLNEDGTQYGVYDWARDLSKSLRKNLGVKVSNRSQGLGDIALTIEGMK